MGKILNLSRKKKFVVVIVLILVIIVGIFIVKGLLSGPSTAMIEATAVKQDLAKYYSFSGNVESGDVQYVTSKTNEPVKKFYVEEGDKVKVGDLLYEVDSNTIQSTLTTASTSLSNAKINYDASKLDYERKQELYNIGGVTLQELETANDSLTSAQNQVTQAQASYDQAQKQYEDTRCYAEVSGEVSKIYLDENKSIIQGASIMDIINYENLEIKIKVDEYDLSAISEGMNAEVYIEAIGKTITGTISEIAQGASVENGVSYFETTVTLPIDRSIRVGLSAEVKVVTQSANDAITVPVNAVINVGKESFVQRYNNKGDLEKISVTVGINNGIDMEIKRGLNEGDTVVYTSTSDSSENTTFGPGAGGGNQLRPDNNPKGVNNGPEAAQ